MDKSEKKHFFIKRKAGLARLDILPFIFLHAGLVYLLNSVEISTILSYIAFFGLLFLQAFVFFSQFWSNRVKKFLLFDSTDFDKATHVYVSITHQKFKMNDRDVIVPVQGTSGEKFIVVENIKYVQAGKEFKKPPSFKGKKVKQFLSGESEYSQDRVLKYGDNRMKMPIPTFLELYKEHVVAPFFVFQLFCIMLWIFDDYGMQSFTSLTMLCIFEATVVSQRIVNLTSLRKMRVPPHFVMVYRNHEWIKISSEELIPGDIVSVVEGLKLDIVKITEDEKNLGFFEKLIKKLKEAKEKAEKQRNRQNMNKFISQSKEKEPLSLTCDMLLLCGSATVNEAMLTGESTPQIKESLEKNDTFWEDTIDYKKKHKNCALFAGTSVVKTSVSEEEDPLPAEIKTRPPDGGVICKVIKTGFSTSQGKLLRTVLFSQDRNMGDSTEPFIFIFILFGIALYSSYIVLIDGLEREGEFTYKLFLRIIIILTSVVPSELPIEMTLAINHSLFFLQKKKIMCIEPFRIPFAGKVDTLCFDKTGTLTKDEFIVKGIVNKNGANQQPGEVAKETLSVLLGCNSLQSVKGKMIGDPIEVSIFQACQGTVGSYEVISSKINPSVQVKSIRRYPFESSLKRMSVLANVTNSQGSSKVVLTKGAPEALRSLLREVPSNYDSLANQYANEGFRLLTLAYREAEEASVASKRGEIENNLHFAGFLLVETPLKSDTAKYINQFKKAQYPVLIITGDHKYTTAKVAGQLNLSEHKIAFLKVEGEAFHAFDLTGNLLEKFAMTEMTSKKYCFGIEGVELDKLIDNKAISKYICDITIFARVNPNQKDDIIKVLIENNRQPSMCGDGSNDVGALKRSIIGVALLNADEPKKKKNPNEKESPFTILTLEDDTLIKSGDVTAAAPFTSKSGSIRSVKNILIQGRCTLVITFQMYKILALNCLMSAYSFSVLAMSGVKFNDYQSTYHGFATAFLFMMLSRAKPLKKLNEYKPQTTIFTLASIISIVGQATCHYFTLQFLINLTAQQDDSIITEVRSLDDEFKKTLLNTVCYICIFFIQANNFLVNYQGEPFMEKMTENKWMVNLVLAIIGATMCAIFDLSPLVTDALDLLPLPEDGLYRLQFAGILLGNFVICWLLENWKKLIK